MNRGSIIIILHAFVVPGLAEDQKSADTSVDMLTSKLTDKLLAKASSLYNVNMDDTTFAKTHPDKSMGLPVSRAQATSLRALPKSQILASLPGPSSIKNSVMSAFESTNRRCQVISKAAETLPDSAPMPKDKVLEMPGISAPLGFFDPLGISAKVPEGRLLFYREAELKHGRVCMLAILGLIVGERQDFIPVLGDDIPKDTAAYLLGTPYVQGVHLADFWPWALAALAFEEYRHPSKIGMENLRVDTSKVPGDYGWDPLNLKPKDAKAFNELQTKELNNGRLAMFATAGIIAQEQLTGKNLLPNFLPH